LADNDEKAKVRFSKIRKICEWRPQLRKKPNKLAESRQSIYRENGGCAKLWTTLVII
jgi:hypothetical protein